MEKKVLNQFIENDAILKNIIATIPEPQIQSTNNVFHDLLSCILEQQIHYRSTKKVFQKMLNSASLEILTPENFAQFEEMAFSNIKLSIEKYETLLRIIEFWNENTINWQGLNDEEVIEKLSSIKGIGKWTIDMILLYTLQRPNVFPYDDFHLKEIMVKLYGLDPNVKLKAQMIEVSNAWGNHKSLAVKYLLAWKEFRKKEK
jgi:DNA-3-methyladenine glycosylase II